MHEFTCSSVRWWDVRSPALVHCCWDTGEPSHWESRSGRRTLFLSWILELLIYIVRQKVIFFPFECIGTALSIIFIYPLEIQTLLALSSHAFVGDSGTFFYSILLHSGESAVSQRSLVGCLPKFTWHQNTPKASASGNSVVYVRVVWIYFLETQSDSKLFTCCKEPVPWLPEAALHQPSIHHLPPVSSLPLGCSLPSSNKQPPCTQFQ